VLTFASAASGVNEFSNKLKISGAAVNQKASLLLQQTKAKLASLHI
jgi:hypothetical protein